MTRRAYLRRRAQKLRHGMTRTTHGARVRRRITRRIIGVDFASSSSRAVVAVVDRGIVQFTRTEIDQFALTLSIFELTAAIQAIFGNLDTSDDCYESLERAGAKPEFVEALRAEESVWRLRQMEEGFSLFHFSFNAQGQNVFNRVRGLLTINEIRHSIGLPPLKNGDVILEGTTSLSPLA